MSIHFFVEGLGKILDPQAYYHHPIQIALFGSVTYLSTICFTTLSPFCTVSFIVIAYTINQIIVPYFCRFLILTAPLPFYPSSDKPCLWVVRLWALK